MHEPLHQKTKEMISRKNLTFPVYIPEAWINEYFEWEDIERRFLKEETEKRRQIKFLSLKEACEVFEVSPEEAREMRQRYCKEEFRRAVMAHAEAEIAGTLPEALKPYVAKVNKTRFALEVATITEKRLEEASEEEIGLARQRHIKDFLPLTPRGFARCPFHQEKTGSFHAEGNLYYCFGCGAKGDVIDFVMKTQGLSFRSAVKLLSNQ